MTLADEIAKKTRRLSQNISINGVRINPSQQASGSTVPGVTGLTLQKSIDSPCPTCNITVDNIPAWVERGHLVEIDLGYNGLTQRVFTGYVQDRAHAINGSSINCAGKLFAAYRTVQIPERDMTGDATCDAMGDILDYVGVTDRVINAPDTDFTLGTAAPALLDRMPASQMLETLMEINGHRVRELGSGQVVITQMSMLPAPSAFRSYSSTNQTTAFIIDGSDREDPNYVKTRVTVTGATIIEGAAPDETSRTISIVATAFDIGLIRPPLPSGTYIDAELSNPLVDTDDQATAMALRLIGEWCRIPRQVSLDIPFDPQLEIGMTVGVDFPENNVEGNWFVYGINHSISPGEARTVLDLRGGGEAGGDVDISPIANFTYKTEREVVGDRVWVAVTFDASASYDPDGSIASYAWSDNQTTTPEIETQTGTRFAIAVDPTALVGSWLVTLTVTDDQGLTGTITKTINVGSGEEGVQVPAIYAAIDNNASCTPDGGITWFDQANANCVSVAARPTTGEGAGGVGLFGFTDGSIKKTTDSCRTALTTVLAADPSHGTITRIRWDAKLVGWVFAGTDTGQLWFSLDEGDTWDLYYDFGANYPIYQVIPLARGVAVCGGRADEPTSLIKFDAGGTLGWVSPVIDGHLAEDIVGAPSSIHIVDAAMTDQDHIMIILSATLEPYNPGSGVSIYYFASGGSWERAVGLDPGLSAGAFVVEGLDEGEFYAAFNNRDVWKTSDGINFTKSANFLPANCVPHHCEWIPDFSGVYIVAVEDTVAQTGGIYKTFDKFASGGWLRPATGFTAWPAGAIGRQVALGEPGYEEGDILALFVDGGAAHVTQVCERASGVWTVLGNIPRYYEVLKKLGDNHYALAPEGAAANDDALAMKRSTDGGTTWVDKLAACIDVARGADGTLWGISVSGSAPTRSWWIYKSLDDGDTWASVYELVPNPAFTERRLRNISCHPTNAKYIACNSYKATAPGLLMSMNGGLAWAGWWDIAGGATIQANVQWHSSDVEFLQ
ncbi:MAG: PKD domain-containing protein, partial [Dehalococcoidia bacterium]|nr:PKD domain-containing protein [Dehalococcoidia bacterium]